MTFQEIFALHPQPTNLDHAVLLHCIEECLDCSASCTGCADASLSETDPRELIGVVRLALDCADACEATGRVVIRQTASDLHVMRALVQSCARACLACADECERHAADHAHCRVCADVCRRCRRACDDLLALEPMNPGSPAVSSYRHAARQAVSMSIAPYGYSLTVWSSGALLTHARGFPGTVDALFFMLGAVGGFALVGVASFGKLNARARVEAQRPALWAGFHAISVGVAIGAAAAIVDLVENRAAWPLGGFAATTSYLVVLAGELVVAS